MGGGVPGIGVVGSGYWGKNLVRNFHGLGALKVLCDNNEMVLDSLRAQYPGMDICLALSGVLSREDVQGVVIATPAETHFTMAREALLAGKHVYVEKPLVLDEDEARELIGLARSKGLVLMVGHLLQYHPVFETLRSLVAAGDLGRVNYIYSHRLNLGKIRREENILWSFAPHDISMILALAGEMPESVLATGANYLHSKIADVTTTHLRFSSGLHAHIFVSWLHPFKEQKLVVVGDKKMAVFDDTLPWAEKLRLYPHTIKWEGNVPVPNKADAELVAVEEGEPLRAECLHFLDCIQNKRQPRTDGGEGLRVLTVLNAAQRSMNQGGASVPFKTPDLTEKTPSQARPSPPSAGAFVHETALVDHGAVVGSGTKIWHFSHVLSGSRVGAGCNIGQNVVIGPDASVGDGCKIQNNVSVYKGVTLEEGVFCGPSMVFTNVYNPRAHIKRMSEIRPTLVKKGATLGANCTIVCGVTIGKYAFVGAGAVITRDVPDHALVVGNPAHRIGWVCQCGERLDENFSCASCGASIDPDRRQP